MGGLSAIHWIIVLIIALIYFVPIVKVLNKAGYSGWWSLLVFVPLVNIVMFWVFAFADWPALRGSGRQ
jgi:uncharacterized membrane protein YhaH (DUF805 family)